MAQFSFFCDVIICCSWLCGGATGLAHTWSSIEDHECGRYEEKHGQETERARKELWRYTHYYNRYKAHKESLEAEEKSQQKITSLESRNLKDNDYCWLSNGFHRLIRSRKFLLYSYPFAYYMFGEELFENEMSSKERTIKLNLFEDQQQQLEANIERLSMFLEKPIAKGTKEAVVFETKENVITLSAVTDTFCRKL